MVSYRQPVALTLAPYYRTRDHVAKPRLSDPLPRPPGQLLSLHGDHPRGQIRYPHARACMRSRREIHARHGRTQSQLLPRPPLVGCQPAGRKAPETILALQNALPDLPERPKWAMDCQVRMQSNTESAGAALAVPETHSAIRIIRERENVKRTATEADRPSHILWTNMAYCNEHLAVKQEGDKSTFVSLPCRAWTCPDCAPKRKKQLTAQAIAGRPDMFLTFTVKRSLHPSDRQAAKALSYAFRLLRLRIMRKFKRPFPFLAVVERHPGSKWPHIHVLARSKYISQKWLSAQMMELLKSPVVHVTRIDNPGRAAVYCSKYCSKCSEKIGTTKRYWQSKDYDLRDDEEKAKYKKGNSGFTYTNMKIGTILEMVEYGLWTMLKAEKGRFEIWTGIQPP